MGYILSYGLYIGKSGNPPPETLTIYPNPRPLLYTLTLTLNMLLTYRDPQPETLTIYPNPNPQHDTHQPRPPTRDPNPNPNPGSLLWFLVVGVYKY
jgi:hypothetical protein